VVYLFDRSLRGSTLCPWTNESLVTWKLKADFSGFVTMRRTSKGLFLWLLDYGPVVSVVCEALCWTWIPKSTLNSSRLLIPPPFSPSGDISQHGGSRDAVHRRAPHPGPGHGGGRRAENPHPVLAWHPEGQRSPSEESHQGGRVHEPSAKALVFEWNLSFVITLLPPPPPNTQWSQTRV